MPRSLRFPDETDSHFRQRAGGAARYAKLLIDAALANHCVQQMISDSTLPYSIDAIRRSPIVRIEYEEAYATRNKHWGDGPYIHPLWPDDPVDPVHILYVFKEGSRYNRCYEQRWRLKELLGKRYRPLVERAKYQGHSQAAFLDSLRHDERQAIERILKITPKTFWRACRGKLLLTLPPRLVQLPFLQD